MKIVSGRTGSPHVTSQQFRQMLEGIIGQGSYIVTSGENLKPELSSNNTLKIRSGMMCHHGCVSSVDIGTYDEVTLPNGSQGMKRIDLIVNRHTRNAETEIENCEWKVIMGTPAASNPTVPGYTAGNLQNGDTVDECPVFQVSYDGINVTAVNSLLETVGSLTELNSKTKWKLFGMTTGVKGINIKELVDSGKDIRAVVTAQYNTKGNTIKFVFDISPENVAGTYPDGYCFSPNNYATVAIVVGKSYDLFVQKSWWSMRENASTTIPINDETVKLEVYYR